MNILENIVQGSSEWLEIRRSHSTASEAPAALGKSKYMTRTALITQKFTGLSEDVGAFKQALFDKGHETEFNARPFADLIVESDLYPTTATLQINGLSLLASFDGCTMGNDIIWEHKLFNESLANDIRSGNLDPHYTIQLDQQLLVSGANKCLFMTSDGTEENMAWCWYEPSQDKFDALISGWIQFNSDLASYVPVQIEEKPEAKAVIELPALFLQAEGRLVNSNMEAFGVALAVHLAETRKMVYATDQDFSDADKRAKMYRETCDKLTLTKKSMLSQTVSIDEAFRMIDTWHEDLRTTALQIEKDVKKNKESKQLSIISDGKVSFSEFVADLEKGISPIRLNYSAPNFAEATKGKRLFSAMHDAVQTMLANTKVELSQVVAGINANLNWLKDHEEFKFLLNDLQSIVYKQADDFQLLVNSRIAEHKQREAEKLEAERARIRLEEEAKAKAAQEKINAEVEAARAASEAKAAAEAKSAQDKINAEAEAQRVAAAKIEADRKASEAVSYPPLTAELARVIETVMTVPVAHPFPTRTAAPTDTPTLTLGKIGTRLGFSLTADFLRSIGFEPAGRERAAMLYHESDWQSICAALVNHISKAREPQQQAA